MLASFLSSLVNSPYSMVTIDKKQVRKEQRKAISLSESLLETSKDINTVYTISKRVRAVFHTHFVDMKNEKCGIADLIVKILKANNAFFKAGIEETENRATAIAASMFTSTIADCVVDEFSAGSIRYPLATVKHYLSTVLVKKGLVVGIQLTNEEDSTRECSKPRCVWYVVNANPVESNPVES